MKPDLAGGRPDQRTDERILSYVVTYRKGFRYIGIYDHVKAPQSTLA